MSSRTILSGRRTRIYDSNYNIGESYYRSAIDRLDRKYSVLPLSPSSFESSLAAQIADRHSTIFANEDLKNSRRRTSHRIREGSYFDSRGARISRGGDSFEEDGINEETSSTITRIRAAKTVAIIDDVDLESAASNLKTQRLLDRSEKILDSIGLNESSASKRMLENDFAYQKRSLKVSLDTDADNLTKWSPVSALKNGELNSGAAIRAGQSRARIDELGEEMAAMKEKQAARERRVARLKQLVAECDSETVDNEGVSERKTKKNVQF